MVEYLVCQLRNYIIQQLAFGLLQRLCGREIEITAYGKIIRFIIYCIQYGDIGCDG